MVARNGLRACILLGTLLLCCWPGRATMARAAQAPSYPTMTVSGLATAWRIHVLGIHRVYRFPDVAWSGYSNDIEFLILTVDMTNVGSMAARPVGLPQSYPVNRVPVSLTQYDLFFAVRVLPGHPTRFGSGWAQLSRAPWFDAMVKSAARTYGGTLPWIATAPGKTTRYCMVIGAARESPYGLYVYARPTEQTFLGNTGF